jgi:tetratricopeptide (TPR) repeat protein
MDSEPRPKKAARARLQSRPLFRRIDEHFNDVIVVFIALVTVFTGLIAYLESWADNHYAAATRDGQVLAMDALGNEISSRQRESYDFSLYTTWSEWQERHNQATGSDLALAARSLRVADLIAPLTPLLDESQPYFTPETVTQTYAVDLDAYHVANNLIQTTIFLEKRAFAIETASIWNGKADGYVTVITVLAVALFLYGLSTTIKTGMRYLFAIVGTFLVGLATLGALDLTLRPVPVVPPEAIEAYARGVGLSYTAEYEEASQAFDAALLAYPDYGNAYHERGKAHLRAEDLAAAVADFLQAIEHGHEAASTYWELGWAYYLLGDYPASVGAGRHGLQLDPSLLPVVMNIGTALLAGGDSEAAMEQYELGLAMAADPNSTVPLAWNHLYLRESVNDLDRLIAALDGQTGFVDEPDLSHVADRAALRAAADAARLRLKEGMVALEVAGRPRLEETQASLSPLTFARFVGRMGDLLGESDTFARGELAVVAALSYDNLPPGAVVSRRVLWQWTDEPGLLESLPTMGEDLVWDGGAAGTWQHVLKSPWPGDRGLRPGHYLVEYYVNSHLLQTASFDVPQDDVPTLAAIAFGTDCGSGGIPVGAAGTFPAGTSKIYGLVNYSGIPKGSRVVAQWVRDGERSLDDELVTASSWGSLCYDLDLAPPGEYRLDLAVDGQVLQSATFEVLEIDGYRQAIGQEPDDPRFHLDLGDAYAHAGDAPQAAAHYERAIQLDAACARCYYQWWSILYDQGSYAEAATKLQQAIELRPKEYDYLTSLAKTYYKLGQEQEAIAAYRQAIPLNPAYVYNDWGNALYNLERYEEAAAKYGQSLELNPDDEVVHANLGGAYRELGQYEKAAAEFEQAVSLDPGYASAYNRWGDTLYDQERYAEAMEKYQRAADLAPGEALYVSNLGWAAYNLKQYEQAAASFQRAVEFDPQRPADWNKWGDALYALGQYSEAADRYQEAMELRPDIALYPSNLGWAYFALDDYEQAAAGFQRAVELDGGRASDWNMWGRALYEQGLYREAAEKHQRAVDASPETAVYHLNLGIDYYQLGEDDMARTELRRAAELATQEGDQDLRQSAEEMLDLLK